MHGEYVTRTVSITLILDRIMDLEMLTTFNARERPLADWVKLCAEADSRLKLHSVSKPEGSVLSILEFVYEGGNQA